MDSIEGGSTTAPEETVPLSETCETEAEKVTKRKSKWLLKCNVDTSSKPVLKSASEYVDIHAKVSVVPFSWYAG